LSFDRTDSGRKNKISEYIPAHSRWANLD